MTYEEQQATKARMNEKLTTAHDLAVQRAWEAYWRRIREALDARPASQRPHYHADLATRPGAKPETDWRFPVNRRDRWYIK